MVYRMTKLRYLIRWSNRGENSFVFMSKSRLELAQREQAEIDVIRRFMPNQLEGEAFQAAIQDAILEVDAKTIKDMGKTMALLKQKYPGQMDFSKARLYERNLFRTQFSRF